MPSSIDKADVIPHEYRRDAVKIARHVADHGKLPGSLRSYDFHNAFAFATGTVPEKIRNLYSLGQMASFSDLGKAIERKLSPPKPAQETIYVGDRPMTEKELRREATARKADASLTSDGRNFGSAPPATRKAEAEGETAPAASDWRSAIKGI
jgi:hypothetical protein